MSPRARRLLLAIFVISLLAPIAGAGTVVSNTKVASPQIGNTYFVGESSGADWGAKLADTVAKVGSTGGRITDVAGLHTATTVVTVSKSNVLLDFYGAKISSPSQAANILTFSGHNITLIGAEIDAANITGSSCAVRITGSNVTLRDVIIRGGPKGVCVEGGIGTLLDHVLVEGQTSIGVSIATAAQGTTLQSSTLKNVPTGVSVSADSTNTRLLFNLFADTSTAAVTDASASTIRLDSTGLTLNGPALQRDAADRLKTPGSLIVSTNLGVGVSTAPVRLAVSDGSSAVAQTGLIGLPNNAGIKARNAANNGDLPIISTDTSNNVVLGGSGVASVTTAGGFDAGTLAATGKATGTHGYFPTVVANTSISTATLTATSTAGFGSSPAQSGLIRIPNDQGIYARNAANNGDLVVIGTDGSNRVVLGAAGGAGVTTALGLEAATLTSTGKTTGTHGYFPTLVANSSLNAGTLSSSTITTTGAVGIGEAPVTNSVLNVRSLAAGALPATSGTTQSTGLIQRLRGAGNDAFDIGMYSGIGGWIQVSTQNDLSAHNPLLIQPVGGKVGIGTSLPAGLFHVSADTNSESIVSSHGGNPTFTIRKSQGSSAAPTTVLNGDSLAQYSVSARGASNYVTTADQRFVVESAPSGDIIPTYYSLRVMDSGGALSERFHIQSGGNIYLHNRVNDPNTRLFIPVPTSAAPAQELFEGTYTAHVDEVGNTLTFRVKYSDGTVKTGTVALT